MDDPVINLDHLQIPDDIDHLGGFDFDELFEELAEEELAEVAAEELPEVAAEELAEVADEVEEINSQKPSANILKETRKSLDEAQSYADKSCNLIKSALDDGSMKSTASLLACQAEIRIAIEALGKATSNLCQAENHRRTRSKLLNRTHSAAAWRRASEKLSLAENDQDVVVVPRGSRSKLLNRTHTAAAWLRAHEKLSLPENDQAVVVVPRGSRSKLLNRTHTAAAWLRAHEKLSLAENDQAVVVVVVPRRI